ncbi:MAG: hypothetical protein Q9170_003070 [Blastenia crenularia]
MATTVEAIVAAVYLDGGLAAAEIVVQNLGLNALEKTIPKFSLTSRVRRHIELETDPKLVTSKELGLNALERTIPEAKPKIRIRRVTQLKARRLIRMLIHFLIGETVK